MLTRLYVDNYKCLVNFDLRLGRQHLLMGGNGTGKSTVFEVLSALRLLLHEEERVEAAFPSSTLTRWQARSRQVVELEASLDGASYRYRLEVEQSPEGFDSHIAEEALLADDEMLFISKKGSGKLFNDDGSEGPNLLVPVYRSALPFVPTRNHRRLARFQQWMARILVVRIDPRRMSGRSEGEERAPREDLSNFASWYRHLTQERLDEAVRLRDSLRDIFPGFEALDLKSEGEGIRKLRSRWQREPKQAGPPVTDDYAFEELSDGQRALIGLYTLLHAMEDVGATLCLDEPDNFVALREVQPFLLQLQERERIQALIVSHHPEVINLLAPGSGLSFERVAGGPVRVSPFSAPDDIAVPPSEWIARGWEDGK